MESESLEDRVKQMVATHMAVNVEQLTADTRLLHDLGADGMDGCELIEMLGNQFGVDLSEFDAGLHFGPEGVANPITALITCLFRPRWARFIPITIGDMVQAAQTGKWYTPNREAI